ncbi:hypothetical protein DH20_22325 [Pantoea agglomerans]|jgi:hypothetical protein|nr:hypothetical protein [Pantoea agglomerans]
MIPACRSDDNEYEVIKGDHIGCGHARYVFEIKGNSDFVLKEAKPGMCIHNENEATFYFMSVEGNHTAVTDCIAEVRSISKSGKYLIMERLCMQLDSILKSEAKVPIEINDPHAGNYGMTPDRKTIKCIDYGSYTTKEISGDVKPVPFQSELSINEMSKLNNDIKKLWE